jgi:predicted PurR-regulated permease PerM
MSSEWQRSLVGLVAAGLIVVVLAIFYWARAIFLPVAVAIFLTFVLTPLVAWAQHRGLNRSLSVIAVVGIVVLVSTGIGLLVTHQVVHMFGTLADRRETIKEKIIHAKESIAGTGDNRFSQLVNDVTEVIFVKHPQAQPVVVERGPAVTSWMESFVSPAAEFLGQAILTFILTVYMLIRREDLRNRMIRLLGAGKVTTTTKAVDEASRRISRYLLMQLVVNVTYGFLISLGLFLLQVEYALLWGFLAGLLRYVPYVGIWVAVILPFLFAFATATNWWDGWGQPATVFILFVGLDAIVSNVVEPWLYGSSMGISEIALLIAAAVWAFIWGPVGLILSGPLTACMLVLGKYVRGFEFLEVLLGDEPALAPQVAFYQRLTARDQDEAADIALTVAKDGGPDVALETVVLPGICLARRDREAGDLDSADFDYAIHAAREVATEVAELRPAWPEAPSGEERVKVMICPARDEAEHLASELLASALDPAKWETNVVSNELLASELLDLVDSYKPAVVVLVALPPGGLSHSRYLISRIRSRNADRPILLARWGEDTTEAGPSDTLKGVTGVDRVLSATLKRLAEMHPVLVATKKHHDETDRKGETVERKPQAQPTANPYPALQT